MPVSKDVASPVWTAEVDDFFIECVRLATVKNNDQIRFGAFTG